MISIMILSPHDFFDAPRTPHPRMDGNTVRAATTGDSLAAAPRLATPAQHLNSPTTPAASGERDATAEDHGIKLKDLRSFRCCIIAFAEALAFCMFCLTMPSRKELSFWPSSSAISTCSFLFFSSSMY